MFLNTTKYDTDAALNHDDEQHQTSSGQEIRRFQFQEEKPEMIAKLTIDDLQMPLEDLPFTKAIRESGVRSLAGLEDLFRRFDKSTTKGLEMALDPEDDI
jgi:hypothetical protein